MAVPKGFSVKATIAELMATCLFVFIGTGAAVTFSSVNGPAGWGLSRPKGIGEGIAPGQELQYLVSELDYISNNLLRNPSWGVITALAFGLAITVLAYATGHLSGGQMNPAVTFGLVGVGALNPMQGLANLCAQIVGAILGSAFLLGVIPDGSDSALGSNRVAPGVSNGNAFLGEAVMTFVLVSVVLETAVNHKSLTIRQQAPLAIGFAVFTAHAVLLPIDGCSINPARSLGPAIVSGTWPGNFWIFVVGPFVGALFAIPFHLFWSSDFDTVQSRDPISLEPAGPSLTDKGTLGSTSGDPVNLARPESPMPKV
ncbi:hypothetical protein N2152v2_001580 [Parachlorella kessleri]